MTRIIGLVALTLSAIANAAPQGSSASATASSPIPSSSSSGEPLSSDQQEALYSLHEKLVEIPSISDDEIEVATFLEEYLTDLDYYVQRVNVTAGSEGRFNVFAYPQELKDQGEWPEVLITSHLDTVPPFIPFERRERNGSVYHYGRGTVDAKGCIAAQVIAADGYISSQSETPSLGMLFVVGEETGGDGMQAFAEYASNVTFRAGIFGEPTEGKLATGHKGIDGVVLRVEGRPAHSAYQWLGINAINWVIEGVQALNDLEPSLPAGELLGNSTLNVGLIAGGLASNIVPENANATASIRIADGEPEAIREIVAEALAPVIRRAERAGAIFNVTYNASPVPPQFLDYDVPGLESAPVFYGTDIPSLPQVEKRYLYGTSTIQVAHTPLEEISQDELVQAVNAYRDILAHVFESS